MPNSLYISFKTTRAQRRRVPVVMCNRCGGPPPCDSMYWTDLSLHSLRPAKLLKTHLKLYDITQPFFLAWFSISSTFLGASSGGGAAIT
jgi:hypothetical protein